MPPSRMPSPLPRPLRTLLAVPGLRSLLGLALLARLAYATVGLALLLALERASGSWAVAGGGLVAYGLTAGLLAPVRAQAVDRWGAARVLLPLALASAVALALLSVLTVPPVDASAGLVLLAGAAGCLLPPLGPVTRAALADLVDSPDLVRAAYSLDTVAEEGLFTAGPLLVGLVVAAADPGAALLLTALLLAGGTVAMSRSPLLPAATPPSAAGNRPGPSPLRSGPFLRLLAVLFAAGLGLGGLELALVAVTSRLAGPTGTGVVLATLGLASAAGGGVYGSRRWPGTAGQHLRGCCLLLGVGLGGLALATRSGRLPVVAAACAVVGLGVAPLLVAAYTSADALSGVAARTRAGTLVGTVTNLGVAGGTAVAGVLVERAGPGTALLAGSLVLMLAGAVPSPGPDTR